MMGTEGGWPSLAQVEVDGRRPGVEAGVSQLLAQDHDLVLIEIGDPRRRGPRTPTSGLKTCGALQSVAKRLLPVAVASGYQGSARNFRRPVAEARSAWRSKNHRATWWSSTGGRSDPLFVFCAVVAWSRYRFVNLTDNLGAEATMEALAECFERIGGVPRTASPTAWAVCKVARSPASSFPHRLMCASNLLNPRRSQPRRSERREVHLSNEVELRAGTRSSAP